MYQSIEFPSVDELRIGAKRLADPDTDTEQLASEMYRECQDLFKAMSVAINNYVSNDEPVKLGLLFQAVQLGINDSIDLITDRQE